MVTKIVSTVTVMAGLIAVLIVRAKRNKLGGIRARKTEEGNLVFFQSLVSGWSAYIALAVGVIVSVCAVMEEKKGDVLYGLTLGAIFLCAGFYWLIRFLRWRVELSETDVCCRGPIGKRRFSWKDVYTAKMLYEYVPVSREVMVELNYGNGKSVRFPVPEKNAEEVKAIIRKQPKIIFNSTQNRSSMDFEI